MRISQYEIWLADLNPRIGTESGKTRPVLIVQTDLLNHIPHPSTIICPLTTNIQDEVKVLRVRIDPGITNLDYNCDIMIDQIRAIDNQRLIKKIGRLTDKLILITRENIKICLDLN